MKKTAAEGLEELFQALGDRTRVRLLNLMADGEVCVCFFVEVLDEPQPKISRHLAYLRNAGLVLARKQGLWSYYRLAAPRDRLHRKLLECLACCEGLAPEQASDAAALRAAKRRGNCC